MRIRVDFVDQVGVDCLFIVLHFLFSEGGCEAVKPFFTETCQFSVVLCKVGFTHVSIYSLDCTVPDRRRDGKCWEDLGYRGNAKE